MASFTGVVQHSDLEGGIWQLHADDGQVYQIRGGGDGLRVAGLRVRIEGQLDGGGFGIGMTGAYLDVDTWTST